MKKTRMTYNICKSPRNARTMNMEYGSSSVLGEQGLTSEGGPLVA
jgi:hypothetical protein